MPEYFEATIMVPEVKRIYTHDRAEADRDAKNWARARNVPLHSVISSDVNPTEHPKIKTQV